MAEEGFDAFEAALRDKFGTTEPEEATTSPEAEAAPEEPVVSEAEEAPASRARDEQGRFTKVEEPILGKFNSVDDLVQAYQHAERRLGELGGEVGELRQLREQFEEMRAQLSRPTTPNNFADLLEEDPATAAEMAYRAGDELALRQATAAWELVAPGAPRAWARAVQAEHQLQQMRQEMDARFQPVQEQAQRQQLESNVEQLRSQFGGDKFNTIAGHAVQLLESDPELARALADPQRQTWALNTAFRLAAAEQGENLSRAATELQQQDAEAARAAKTAAAVVSASSTPASREDKGAIDRFKESILGAEIGLVDRFG